MMNTQVDWGSVPDWFAGIGSTFALIFAALAVRAANSTNKQQAEQLRILGSDRARWQAVKVIATYRVEEGEGNRTAVYKVFNASELPIFDALVFGYRERPGPKCLEGGYFQNIVQPGHAESSPAHMPVPESIWVGMVFLDASSRMWLRGLHGRLRELSQDEYRHLLQAIGLQLHESPDLKLIEAIW